MAEKHIKPQSQTKARELGPHALHVIGDATLVRRAFWRRQSYRAPSGLQPATVIVGGSRGIGFAFAECAVRRNHDVFIVSRTEASASAASHKLSEMTGHVVQSVGQDMTVPGAASRLVELIEAGGFEIETLICSAGIGQSGPFITAQTERLTRLIELNVRATAEMCRLALPKMVVRGKGGIILMSSLGAVVPGPNQSAYYASKAFVTSFGEALAAEVAGTGVRVTTVMPGPVETKFHSAMGAEQALYRSVLPQLSPERVVRSATTAYALGLHAAVPGLVNKVMYAGLKILPRRLSGAITGVLLKNRIAD